MRNLSTQSRNDQQLLHPWRASQGERKNPQEFWHPWPEWGKWRRRTSMSRRRRSLCMILFGTKVAMLVILRPCLESKLKQRGLNFGRTTFNCPKNLQRISFTRKLAGAVAETTTDPNLRREKTNWVLLAFCIDFQTFFALMAFSVSGPSLVLKQTCARCAGQALKFA